MVTNKELEQRIDGLLARMEGQKYKKVTPLQRSRAVWNFQEPDRLLKGFSFFSPRCLGIKEVTTREYYTDPIRMYYCQAVAIVEWGNEIPLMYGDAYNIEVEAMGGKIFFPQESLPAIKDPLVAVPADLLQLKAPDPAKDGRMPYVLELNRIHARKLGSMFFAPTACTGPFSLAVGLRGYRNLLRDIKKDPLFVHDLLEFCCQVTIDYGKALCTVNDVSPTLQEAWSCLPNVSPSIFYEFCQPYITRCIEALRHPRSGEVGPLFYGWGTSLAPNWQAFLRTICAMGMSGLPITEEEITGGKGYRKIDLARFKEISRRRNVVLMAFLHTDTLLGGPPAKIKGMVKDWFQKAGAGSGFLISTSMPVDVPRANVDAYLEAVEECTYPLSKGSEKE